VAAGLRRRAARGGEATDLLELGQRYFDAAEAAACSRYPDFGVPPHNDTGGLGWGTAWRMQAYLLMAQRSGDPRYVACLAELIDLVLDRRDDRRGLVDHAGRSGPVWSSAGKYTIAGATVPDQGNRPAFVVDVRAPHRDVQATVKTTRADRFSVTVTWGTGQVVHMDDASLSPRDPRRIDRLAHRLFRQETGVTVRCIPAAGPGEPGRCPREGRYTATPQRVVLAAQTGTITYPMVGLARLTAEQPAVVPTSVARRVPDYVSAAEQALAFHENQWRDLPGDRGCYVWLPEEPVGFAGAELPTNEFLAMGRTAVQLAVIGAGVSYADRAAALARTLRSEMHVHRGGIRWTYWPSFGRMHNGWRAAFEDTEGTALMPRYRPVRRWEDATHALLDLDFVCLYATAPGLPPVFTRPFLRDLGRTMTHSATIGVRHLALRQLVVPTSPRGTARHQAHVAAWLPLRRWWPPIAELVATLQPDRPPRPLDADVYCGALLACWG
jgi:hypothetical protein